MSHWKSENRFSEGRRKDKVSCTFGWTIWETPGVCIEAEFHSVWQRENADLVDITPKPDGEQKILYLRDDSREYTGMIVANFRYPVIDNPHTRQWILVELKKDELKRKHFYNDEIDTQLVEKELKEWIM